MIHSRRGTFLCAKFWVISRGVWKYEFKSIETNIHKHGRISNYQNLFTNTVYTDSCHVTLFIICSFTCVNNDIQSKAEIELVNFTVWQSSDDRKRPACVKSKKIRISTYLLKLRLILCRLSYFHRLFSLCICTLL